LVEGDPKSGNVLCWTIRELLTSEELRREGRAMNHCVGSYDRSCVKGTISIWSLQVEDCQQKAGRRVMTIAVQNKSRVINQARGRANAFPGSQDGGSRLRKGHTLMRQWAQQEGLRLARHL
jgi:PcfJ-like protein